MRPITGNTAQLVKDFYTETRGIIRDVTGQVATDEALAPFLHVALDRVPLLIASLFACSVGHMEAAKFLANWPVVENKRDGPEHMLRTQIAGAEFTEEQGNELIEEIRARMRRPEKVPA